RPRARRPDPDGTAPTPLVAGGDVCRAAGRSPGALLGAPRTALPAAHPRTYPDAGADLARPGRLAVRRLRRGTLRRLSVPDPAGLRPCADRPDSRPPGRSAGVALGTRMECPASVRAPGKISPQRRRGRRERRL